MTQKSSVSISWLHVASFVVIALIGFGIYLNSMDSPFIWDDRHLIEENQHIRSWSYAPDILTESMGEGSPVVYPYYRPLQVLSYLPDYYFWREDVRGFHLTSILIHILVAFAFYWFAVTLTASRGLAFLGSLFFVVQPAHTEAVTYLSGRGDPLTVLFMLLCFTYYVKRVNAQASRFSIHIFITYLLALLSKETAFVFPALLCAYHFVFAKRARFSAIAPVVIAILVYFALRAVAMDFDFFPDQRRATTIFERLPAFFPALLTYIRLLLFPFNLHLDYGELTFHWSEPQVLTGVAVLISFCLFVLIRRKKNPLICFGVLWFLFGLAPASNLYPIFGYMAEHHLYLPSLGAGLIVGRGIQVAMNRGSYSRGASIVLVVGFLVYYSSLTIRQNELWRNPIKLYEHTVRLAPHSYNSLNSLAVEYIEQGRFEEALPLLKRALEIRPEADFIHRNLGTTYSKLGQWDQARFHLERAIALEPDQSLIPAMYLGVMLKEIGKVEDAFSILEQAKANMTYDAISIYMLGVAYLEIGLAEEGARWLEKALELDPKMAKAHNDLGIAYFQMGRQEDAVRELEVSLKLDPLVARVRYNLGFLKHQQGLFQAAVRLYQGALELEPNYEKARQQLARARANSI
jgi:protein O-mannosyl-transferase